MFVSAFFGCFGGFRKSFCWNIECAQGQDGLKSEVSSCQAKKDTRRGNSSVPAANVGQTLKARKSGAKTQRISRHAEAKHQDEANQHYLPRSQAIRMRQRVTKPWRKGKDTCKDDCHYQVTDSDISISFGRSRSFHLY